MKCQISKQYERQRTRPRRSPEIQLFSLFAGQACVPIRSPGVTTCAGLDASHASKA